MILYHTSTIEICSFKCLIGKKNCCDDSGGAFTFKNKDLVGVDVKGKYYFDVEDYEVY